MRAIGQSVTRIDAAGKVTGETAYPGDLNMPDQAYMKILFADRPHAIVKSIDTRRAEELLGVLGVFTAKDVPVNEYGLTMKDQPVLCGPGSAKPYTDRVRFIGDQVAVVVAETEALAAEACALIEVEYEDLPVITDVEAARQHDAFLIHPDHASNAYYCYNIRKGDVEKAFAQADVIVEGEYHTPAQEHAYLAPEAGIVYWDEQDRITVAVAGQWTHEERTMIAHALDLPEEKIRVIHPAIGGAFGGREDNSIQIVMALALWRLGQRGFHRPIKTIWSREESIRGHHKRHPYLIRAKWGATSDGRVIAAQSEVLADAGAYNYTSNKVLGNATLTVSGPYAIENVSVDACCIYTNHIPSGAFRGFGGPQGAFAAEMQISKLSEKLGMDPVEIRMKNVIKDGMDGVTQSPLPSPVTMGRVIEECALSAGWQRGENGWELAPVPQADEPHIKRGRGFASGYKNVGFSFGFPERSWATVELHGETEISRAVVHHAGSDVGQGAHTVFTQIAAEALDLPIESIELVVADTALTGDAGSASASRMTFMAGNAIRGAAKLALERWQDEDRPAVAEFKYTPPPTTPLEKGTGKSANPNFAYGYVSEAVDLEVDTETGIVTLLNVVCADDVGKALNPQQIVGQIEGAIVQASGYTLLENFITKDGMVVTDKLSTYLIPTILDIPEQIEPVILEFGDQEGPFGARGMAEMPYIPLAPAIITAFHQATGVWVDSFPLTPERVLRALGKL